MSFLAAVLLLNMDASDAFICLANLLNLTSYLAFFKVSHTLPVIRGRGGGGGGGGGGFPKYFAVYSSITNGGRLFHRGLEI